MKRFFSIVRDVAFVIFVIAICGMIFIMSTGKHFTVGGYQVLRVLTSSMEPAIAENTCIIIKEYPVEQLKVGDIITFTSDDPQIQGYYNTHRIHDIVEENGETLYVTKGDATSDIDAYPVHQDQVAGIYVKELPGGRTLGKCFLALSDNKVYFLVIMLPLTLCLLSYFWQIVGLVTGRYDEDEEEEDDDTEEEEEDEEDGESSDADEYVAEPKDTDGDGGVAEPKDTDGDGDVAELKDTDGDGGVAEPKDTDEMGNNALCEGGYAAESENADEKEENIFDELGGIDESGNRDTDFEVETISGVEKNAEISENNIEEHDNVAENFLVEEFETMTGKEEADEYTGEIENFTVEEFDAVAGEKDIGEHESEEENGNVEEFDAMTEENGVGEHVSDKENGNVEEFETMTEENGVRKHASVEEKANVEEFDAMTVENGAGEYAGEEEKLETGKYEDMSEKNSVKEHSVIEEDLISDTAIEKLLAEAASKIEEPVNSEKERIDKIVEELTTTSVSDEAVEEMRAKLKEKYKKMNIKNS